MRLGTLLIFIFSFAFSFGQQDLMYYGSGQVMPELWNPATYGLRNNFGAYVTYRYQWVGIERPPKSITLKSDFSIDKEKIEFGGGIAYSHVVSGFLSSHNLKIPISLGFKTADGQLRIGVAPGIFQLNADEIWTGAHETDTKFDLDLGVSYSTNDFVFAVGATHVPGNGYTSSNYFIQRRVYSFLLNYKTVVSNIGLSPNILIMYEGSTVAAQILGDISFKEDLFGFSTGYRLRSDFILGGFLNFKNLNISYLYGLTLNALSSSKGSHEIRIGYNLRK